MQETKTKTVTKEVSSEENPKKEYNFGGIEEFSLEKIEESILEESIYLDVFAGSDVSFKENIRPLEGVLPSVLNLSCITYDYNTSKYSHKDFPLTRQIGVIAQEMKAAFPELVRNDKDGDLEVNYSQISTIALQAVKELKSQLDISNERISVLESQIAKLLK